MFKAKSSFDKPKGEPMETMTSRRLFCRPLGIWLDEVQPSMQLELHDLAHPLPPAQRPVVTVVDLDQQSITLRDGCGNETVYSLEQLALRRYGDGHWSELFLRRPYRH